MVVERVKGAVPESVREAWRARTPGGRGGAVAVAGEETGVEGYAVVKGDGGLVGVAGYDHGVKEAEKRNESEHASGVCPGRSLKTWTDERC